MDTSNVLLTRHPVLFIHGLKSFANFFDYWHGIPRYLHEQGFPTQELFGAWRGPLKKRAAQFKKQIMRLSENTEGFHLVSHSLGCIDALHLLSSDDEVRNRAKSVLFICPPFGGTPFAELGLYAQKLKLRYFSLTNETLMPSAATRILATFKKPPHLWVSVWIAHARARPMYPLLAVQHRLLKRYLESLHMDGRNDGLIPVESQQKALSISDQCLDYEGDHAQILGAWPQPSSIPPARSLYLRHCIFLAERDLTSE